MSVTEQKRASGLTLIAGFTLIALLIVVAISADALAAQQPSEKRGVGRASEQTSNRAPNYTQRVADCLGSLMTHGTDRYGKRHAPILVSILDVETRQCPPDPAPLDERWRVGRRGRRNPAGANLLSDQPTVKAMFALSEVLGDEKYARFARSYMDWYMTNLVDEKGFFWWGWHRHYDVFTDQMTGHLGNPHEIHAIHCIAWDRLWKVNAAAVRREIEAIWTYHVIDKKTGEVNRHGDGLRGCDFAMSSGACMYAFAFLYTQTKEPVWLDRAKLPARYYWERRNVKTDLFADRPNAGTGRFDGEHFVTSDTGLHCHALLKCYELTSETVFRDFAMAYLRAYRKYGYDKESGQFWGALKLDGTPVRGPRFYVEGRDFTNDYNAYDPRGHLDFWQPYAAGYEHPMATAQVYAYAYQLTGAAEMLEAARSFARCIEANWPPRTCLQKTWYEGYATAYAPQGTHAENYGRTISFFIHLYVLTGDAHYLTMARSAADEAIAKLFHNGLFRGHPAKPYYEAVDGVGYLLYALLQLDQVLKRPQRGRAATEEQNGRVGEWENGRGRSGQKAAGRNLGEKAGLRGLAVQGDRGNNRLLIGQGANASPLAYDNW